MSEKMEEYTKIIDSAEATEADKARAYNARGFHQYVFLGKHKEAIVDFDKAIALNPNDAHAYYNRGNAQYALEKYDEAIVAYDKAIALNPNDARAYYNRGVTKGELRKYEEAIADYTKAIKHKQDHEDAYHNRGVAQCELKEYEEAIKDFDTAIALNPVYATAYNNRGFAQHKLKKYEEAIADFNKAIPLNPDNATAYLLRGYSKALSGNYKEAIEDYTKVIALNSTFDVWAYHNRASTYYNRGITKLQSKQYTEAIDDLNRALQNGISDKYIQKNEPDTKDGIAQHIFSVFQSVANILNGLKVQKDKKDDKEIQYLSHTTKLSVFIRHLFPIEHAEEQALKKFRLHHIAYANDPTEGTLLFDVLNITKEHTKHTGTIPYVMVASFCGGEDLETLDRLPIWNLYGDDAKGISLIFEKDKLASDTTKEYALSSIENLSNTRTWPLYNDKQGHAIPSTKVLPNTETSHNDKTIMPLQLLYKVHYTNKENVDSTGTENAESINKEIKTIKDSLEEIRKEAQAIYTNTLRLLTGLSYLVKNKSYQYENEYRLLCFAESEHIPKILQYEPVTDKENKDDTPRVYMDTDILEKLHCVMTAPKVTIPQVLAVQYCLDAYSEQLTHLTEPRIKRSAIPYQ